MRDGQLIYLPASRHRMAGYYPGSTPLQPQRLIGTARRNLGGGTEVLISCNPLVWTKTGATVATCCTGTINVRVDTVAP